MKTTIIISKEGKGYQTDCKNLPGTPPVGRGRTQFTALYDWFCKIRAEQDTWLKYIPDGELEIILMDDVERADTREIIGLTSKDVEYLKESFDERKRELDLALDKATESFLKFAREREERCR